MREILVIGDYGRNEEVDLEQDIRARVAVQRDKDFHKKKDRKRVISSSPFFKFVFKSVKSALALYDME